MEDVKAVKHEISTPVMTSDRGLNYSIGSTRERGWRLVPVAYPNIKARGTRDIYRTRTDAEAHATKLGHAVVR